MPFNSTPEHDCPYGAAPDAGRLPIAEVADERSSVARVGEDGTEGAGSEAETAGLTQRFVQADCPLPGSAPVQGAGGAGRNASRIVAKLTEARQVFSFSFVFDNADPSGGGPDHPFPMEDTSRFAAPASGADIGPDLDPL